MKFKTTVVVCVSAFLMLCAGMVVNAVLEHPQQAQALLSRVVPLTSEVAEPAAAETTETEETAQPAEMLKPVHVAGGLPDAFNSQWRA